MIFQNITTEKAPFSIRLNANPSDVIPSTVADADLLLCEPVSQAIATRLANGVTGYSVPKPAPSVAAVKEHLKTAFNWEITDEDIAGFTPGTVCVLQAVARTILTHSGDEVVVIGGCEAGMYPPIHNIAEHSPHVKTVYAKLHADGSLDAGALASCLGPRTRLVILCNPHNPTGHMYSADELDQIADCLAGHDAVLLSDELWADMSLRGNQHVPAASRPGLKNKCVTCLGPNKTFNIAGIPITAIISHNASLRTRVMRSLFHVVPAPSCLAHAALVAAYTNPKAHQWHMEMIRELENNFSVATKFVDEHLAGMGITTRFPKATYLLWLDCREFERKAEVENAHEFFLKNAKVDTSPGANFGAAGFVRMNLATTQERVMEALHRIERACNEAVKK